jgi:hypothetical protein
MTIPAYPLQWPAGWKRMPAGERARARFVKKERPHNSWTGSDGVRHDSSYMRSKELSIADAVTRVRAELERMGVRDDDLVISSNLELRLDGFPRSNQREPTDPGIAVYWRDGKAMRCMAIDRYDRIADNLAAVAATLDAMRAIERHGGAEILDRAFTGFQALPAPADLRNWFDVLGLSEAARGSAILDQYRRLRLRYHPDREGGNAVEFNAVQLAYDQAVSLGYC